MQYLYYDVVVKRCTDGNGRCYVNIYGQDEELHINESCSLGNILIVNWSQWCVNMSMMNCLFEVQCVCDSYCSLL